MKRMILISLVILIFTNYLTAENPCGIMYPSHDSTNWGVGFIRIPINNISALKGTCSFTQKTCYVVNGEIRILNEDFPKINPYDYVYYGGYHHMLLKVYQIKDTKYQICNRSIDGGIWVDFDDFSEDGFKFNTYLNFLSNDKNYPNIYENSSKSTGHMNIGVNLVDSCLNLRVYPSLDSTIVTCLLNNEMNHNTLTHIDLLEIRDDWARVLVREFVSSIDVNNPDGTECSFQVVKEFIGYVKVLDDKGRPNIWYAVSAYY